MSQGFGIHSIRNKLILSFTSLAILTVGATVFLVTIRLNQASEDKINEGIRITVNVLEQVRQNQIRNSSDATAAFIQNKSQLRATLSEYNEADLFEENLSAEEKQEVFQDIVNDVLLFQQSQLFIIVDGQGTVLYQKNNPNLLGKDISEWPIIQESLSGKELFTWWGKDSPIFMDVPPSKNRKNLLYEVFLKPVSFGDDVVGLIIIGFDTSDQPSQIRDITLSEVAFFQNEQLYGTSTSESLHPALEKLVSKIDPNEINKIYSFAYNDEEYLAQASPVLDDLGEAVGTIISFRSKTHELKLFDDLSYNLNVTGILAVISGIFFAYFISRGVTRSVGNLSHGAQEVANGNLDVILDVTSKDELGNLAVTFNKMISGLKEKEHITSTFKKYVSSTIVDEVLKSDVELGGEKKEVTIYFTDLADFTAIGEKLTPEDLILFLNQYFSKMTQILENHSGVLDKYIGDAIMAFWGAPLPIDNHPILACETALEQKKWHQEFHEKWKNQPELANVKTRFGIHTGDVIVGNVGSTARLDYTIIGDSVNFASRLESLNKFYGTDILISEATFDALDQKMLCREIDFVQVKGKNEAIVIFELMNFASEATPTQKSLSELFNQARADYLQRNFDQALKKFQRCINEKRDDIPSQIMINRCNEYIISPPNDTWDGIQIMLRK